MSASEVRNVVEAALLAAGKSLTLNELSQIFDESDRPHATAIRAALDESQALIRRHARSRSRKPAPAFGCKCAGSTPRPWRDCGPSGRSAIRVRCWRRWH